MAHYHTKKELLEDSDLGIEGFFKSSTFTGVFSSSIPDTIPNKGVFCGSITEILINGEEYNITPPFILVPSRFSPFIKDGRCSFKCYIDLETLRNEKHNIRFRIVRIQNEDVEISIDTRIDEAELKALMENLKLRNKLFIGKFSKNVDGSFKISDIRRSSDFSKLIVQSKKEVTPISYHPKSTQPEDEKYYEFSWILTNLQKDKWIYNFKLDESKPIKEIRPYDVIKILNHTMLSSNAGDGQRIVKTLEMLKTQLTASGKEIFIYELLQNANDYPYIVDGQKQKVDVTFHITDDSLLFMHTGAEFNEKNIAAICNINDGEKKENADAIGYKGIGFKTVFLDNNYVYIQSGGFSFRFDEEYTKDMVDTPWQILPVWTDFKELSASERYLFTNAPKDYRVKLALRPTNHNTLQVGAKSYVNMLRELFKDPRSILFIPNISSVTIEFGRYAEAIHCQKDTSKWLVNEYVADIPEEITQTINECLEAKESTLKIPEKYKDFRKTKVSFACETDGVRLKMVEDSILYCYLPTIEAKWGLKFLMNTDMIPTGPRDDIEVRFDNQVNLNEIISGIAGEKLANWIYDLCKERKYLITSVFELVPNFDIMLRSGYERYNELIRAFSNGFLKSIEELAFIPTEDMGSVLLADTILDESGLINEGIMTEEELCTILDIDARLPLKILRQSESFRSFQKRYLKKLDKEENICKLETIEELIESKEFSEWYISIEDKRKTAFLTWLEANGLSSYINDLPIFNFGGEWKSANSISNEETYVITRESTKNITDILDKLGFCTSNNTLEELPLWQDINYRLDECLFDDIIDNVEETALSSEEKLRLFCNKFRGVEEATLSSAKLFTNTLGDVCALKDMCAPYDDAPDYIRQFIINEDEYSIALDKYLVSHDDIFEKIVWPNRDEISANPKELFDYFKWTDSKYTKQLIKDLKTGEDLVKILPIIEDTTVSKDCKIEYLDRIGSFIVNSNKEYNADSFESRVIRMALDVLENPTSFSKKIIFDGVNLSNISSKDEVVCSYNNKRIVFSLEKLLPSSEFGSGSIARFKSCLKDIEQLDRLFETQALPLNEIWTRMETTLGITKKSYWPNGCGNVHQLLFCLYYRSEKQKLNSGGIIPIKLEDETDEFINELLEFLYKNQIKTIDGPFSYGLNKHFQGKFFKCEESLPEERLLPQIEEWALTPERIEYLKGNGVYTEDSSMIKFRKDFIYCKEASIENLSVYEIISCLDYLVTVYGLRVWKNQKSVISKITQKLNKVVKIRANSDQLNKGSKEIDLPEYIEWKKTCHFAIFEYFGEIPYILALQQYDMLLFNTSDYYYDQQNNVLYVNQNVELTDILSRVAADGCVDVFNWDDYRKLFIDNKIAISKEEKDEFEALKEKNHELANKNSKLEERIRKYEEVYGSVEDIDKYEKIQSSPKEALTEINTDRETSIEYSLNSTTEVTRHGKLLEKDNIDGQTRIDINRQARFAAKDFLSSLSDYDCSDWDPDDEYNLVKGDIKYKGEPIVVAICSSQKRKLYLHPRVFAEIMGNPNNLLLNYGYDKRIHSLSFDEVFKDNPNVNLIFDTDIVNAKEIAELANRYMASEKTCFVIENYNYSQSDMIESFGLNEKKDSEVYLYDNDVLFSF